MTHAEICPICQGKGEIPREEHISNGTRKTCHGCDGRGWIEVSDPSYYPIFPDAGDTDASYPWLVP